MCRENTLWQFLYRAFLLVVFWVLSAAILLGAQTMPSLNSRLKSILSECVSLRVELTISQTALSEAKLSQESLEASLTLKEQRLGEISKQAENLASNLTLSVEESKVLSMELAELNRLFEVYKTTSQEKIKQLQGEKVWIGIGCFVGGAVAGALTVFIIKEASK